MVTIVDVRKQHAEYASAPREVQQTVNEAFEAVAAVFKSADLSAGMCDEAEELVAAIYHYYERSRVR